MKIVLDLDSLLSEGKITREEYERLKTLSSKQSVSPVFNWLVACGIIAIASGILSFFPSFVVGIPLGVGMMVAAKWVKKHLSQDWGLLARVLMMVAALMIAVSVFFASGLTFWGFLVVTILMALISIYAREPFIYSLILISLFCVLGTVTYEGRASYFMAAHQPALTILIFGGLGLVFAFFNAKETASNQNPLRLTFLRTAVILANLGFWGGVIWGDSLHVGDHALVESVTLSVWVFSGAWMVALMGFGVLSHRRCQRWGVNMAIFFAAGLFYTRYFAYLKLSSWSVLIAGLIAIVVAWAVVRYNQVQPSCGMK